MTLLIRYRHTLVGLGLCCGYVALLWSTQADLALSRDESMYVYAAERYSRFYELLLQHPSQALDRQFIDDCFRVNHEHPGLAKSLFALSFLLEKHFQLFGSTTLAHRFPGMLSAGLLLWLLYHVGRRYGGPLLGAFAALSFGLLPRVFYHSHLNCFDLPITLATTLSLYTYQRSLLDRRWLWACGLSFGLALAIKHNSWLLPGICAAHFACVQLLQARSGQQHVARGPYFLLAMALLGPPILVLTWPWLWHDGVERFLWYARFHMQHEYYNMAYFGHNYFRPPFPISFPFVMTAVTVPLTTLVFALLGISISGRRQWRAWQQWRGDDPSATLILWFFGLVAPLLVIALPSTPIFGGTKHWFPAYPYMCLFAGLAFAWTARRLLTDLRGLRRWLVERTRGTKWPQGKRARGAVQSGLLLFTLLPGAVETAHSHPFGLSHYTVLLGGIPGAARVGMNRQFWGFTTGSLAEQLRAALPAGGRVYICDMTPLAFAMMAHEGMIPHTIVASRGLSDADYALVHHEDHFADVDFQIWTAYGTVQPAAVLTIDGVPIISMYRNPRPPHAASGGGTRRRR